MKDCIAISNQKGGVAKSSSSNAFGAKLFREGYKVLYVDMDAQGNLSYSMNASNADISSFEVLTGKATIKEAIITTPQGDLIPASSSLASADAIITDTGKEYRLKEALEPVLEDYDVIILDSPPSLGVLTINALTACNSVLIPAQADAFSLQGIGLLSQTVKAVKKYCNHSIFIRGMFITRYNSRTILSRDMTDLLEDTATKLKTKLFKTRIRECIALKEAQAAQQDIFTYAPKSNAARDYNDLVNEIYGEELAAGGKKGI